MSSTIHNLPYKRYVAQVSSGAPRSKSTWLALMAENLEALKACPWREAADVEVALTPHDFTLASYFSDRFDAYKMTGNLNSSDMTEIGYAGMAAYRFKVPADATTRSVALAAVALPISRDRFLKGGVRVAAVLSASATPSADWSVVRGDGEGALVEAERLKQTAANLLAGSPGAETVEIDLSGLSSGNPATYLWVYVTLEDYSDAWEMYDAREKRLYAIEGSAMLVGGSATATFASSVDPDDGPVVLLSGGSSPTWLQPPTIVNAGASAPQVPASAEQVDTFFTSAVYDELAKSATWTITGQTPSRGTAVLREFGFKFTVTLNLYGKTGVEGSATIVAMDERSGTEMSETVTLSKITNSSGTATHIGFVSSIRHLYEVSSTPYAYYMHFYMKLPFTYTSANAAEGMYVVSCSAVKTFEYTGNAFTSTTAAFTNSTTGIISYQLAANSTTVPLVDVSILYWMLRMVGGVPTLMDACDSPSEAARRNLPSVVSGAASPWTVTIDGKAFTVAVSGRAVTLTSPAGQSWAFTLSEALAGETYFDPAVRLHLGDETVEGYGMAAAVGDFSHAAATFEAGSQPGNAEVLGRLARTSRKDARPMLYLHPESGTLADELDALRPVPRFWRTGTDPSGQTSCQPGLSVWYRRPATPSAAVLGIVQRDAAGEEGVVNNPAFLQLALLALRAPSAFAARLVLENKTGASTNGAAVGNHFKLRFVAWRSPAEQWDGSNAFAMAAMASMPSVYRSDGPASVAWSVDCTGSLLRFGTRDMTADRVGVSNTVSGEIAAGAAIEIPLVAPVGEGDVVLIAPEVLGFADGAGGASKWFGRSEDPATATDAGKGWARYAHNLGWFPRVTGI